MSEHVGRLLATHANSYARGVFWKIIQKVLNIDLCCFNSKFSHGQLLHVIY